MVYTFYKRELWCNSNDTSGVLKKIFLQYVCILINYISYHELTMESISKAFINVSKLEFFQLLLYIIKILVVSVNII